MFPNKSFKFKLPQINPSRKNPTTGPVENKFEMSLTLPKDNVPMRPEIDFLVEQQRKKALKIRLLKKREYAIHTQQKIQMQWKSLEEKELVFQRTIVAHNKFLKRNLEKRERALMKIENDGELIRKRQRDIKLLDQKYDFFNAVLIKFREEINKQSIYENYLNSVIENSDSVFRTIHDFLFRYEALEHVKEHCIQRQNEEMSTTIDSHDSSIAFFRRQDIILVENSSFMKRSTGFNYNLPKISMKRPNPKQFLSPQLETSLRNPIGDFSQGPAIEKVITKSRFEEVNDRLIDQRSKCLRSQKLLSDQWFNLSNRETAFRDTVIAHNKFLKANLEKRNRVMVKLNRTRRLIEARQFNIGEINKEIGLIRFILEEMRREIAKHEIYDTFLSKIIENSENSYRSINEILKKYEVLCYVEDKRSKDENKEQFEVARVHKVMISLLHEKTFVVIGLRNEINNLSCKFEDITRRNLATETLVHNIVVKTNELSNDIKSCQHMIEFIYRYICQRRRIQPESFNLINVEPKICLIKSTLKGWEETLEHEPESILKKKKSVRKSFVGVRPSLMPKESIVSWKRKEDINTLMQKQEETLKKELAGRINILRNVPSLKDSSSGKGSKSSKKSSSLVASKSQSKHFKPV